MSNNLIISDVAGRKPTTTNLKTTQLGVNTKDAKIFVNTGTSIIDIDDKFVNKTGDTMTGELILVGNQKHIKFRHTSHNSGDVMWEWDDSGTIKQIGRIWNHGDTIMNVAAGSGTSTDSDGVLSLDTSNNISIGGNSIYHEGNKPTAADVGAVSKAGDTMTGNGITFQKANAASTNQSHIFHDCKGTTGTSYNIRSMRESSGATWVWEKISSGTLRYSIGTTGAGVNMLELQVNAGKVYAKGGFDTDGDYVIDGNSLTGNTGLMNSNGKRILTDHKNGNVTLCATASDGVLYLGYNSGSGHQTGSVEVSKPIKMVSSADFSGTATFNTAAGNGTRFGGTAHKAIVGASSVTNEYLFGGNKTGGTGFEAYLRLTHNNNGVRFSPDGNAQYEIYHQGNKPTPADIGAMPVGGNTRFDWSNTDSNMPAHFYHHLYSGNKVYEHAYPYGTTNSFNSEFNWRVRVGTAYHALQFNNTGLIRNGHKVYDEGNKPTPADIGALASGSTCSTLYANDWFRANGSSGFYCQSHGGGIHMTDSNWLRCYNGKKFLVANSSLDSIRTTGGIILGDDASTRGRGITGNYSATHFQGVFSMGAAYQLPVNGAASSTTANAGNLYGISWTHSNNTNTNAKKISGHHACFMVNGITKAAVGEGGIWSSGVITSASGINVVNGNTALRQGGGNSLKIQTASGNVEIGPQNGSWCHIYTDRPGFYTNKDIYVNNQRVYHTGYRPSVTRNTTNLFENVGGLGTGTITLKQSYKDFDELIVLCGWDTATSPFEARVSKVSIDWCMAKGKWISIANGEGIYWWITTDSTGKVLTNRGENSKIFAIWGVKYST